MTALFPKYFTIRRGQFVGTMLGVCIVPWSTSRSCTTSTAVTKQIVLSEILVSAKAFLTFLSGYGYWLAPIAAVLTMDYYVRCRPSRRTSVLTVFLSLSSAAILSLRPSTPGRRLEDTTSTRYGARVSLVVARSHHTAGLELARHIGGDSITSALHARLREQRRDRTPEHQQDLTKIVLYRVCLPSSLVFKL